MIEKSTLAFASLLSSGPTPWVNKAGLTPCHPKAVPSTVPALAVAAITKRRRTDPEKGAWGLTYKAPSSHPTVHQEGKPAEYGEES